MLDEYAPASPGDWVCFPDDVELFPVVDGRGPIVVQSLFDGIPLSNWIVTHRQWVDRAFARYGALLFRRFECQGIMDFHAALEALGCPPMKFSEETSPRKHLGQQIFTSTEHPASEEIFPHNEGSYFKQCPLRVFFFCENAATAGGETTVVSGRRILELMDADLKKTFAEKGWTYIRRYGTGLGLDWKTAFQTNDPSVVEAYCTQNDIKFRWLDDLLTTQQTRAAIFSHPGDGEPVWCNHVCFFHRTALPSDLLALLEADGPNSLPFDTTYGDGREITATTIEHLRDLYRASTIEIGWRNQDVLMLDNLRFAHGRRPFTGNRRLLFAMSNSEESCAYGTKSSLG